MKMKSKFKTYKELTHDTCTRRFDKRLNLLQECQRSIFPKYRDYLYLQGRHIITIDNYFASIYKLLRYSGKPAEQLIKEDITGFLISRKHLSQKTRYGDYVALKIFLKWLDKDDCIKDVALKSSLHIKLPEEMLNLDEIKRMVQVASNFRDKAFIFMLYETAARKGEFLNLKIKHVSFDEYGAVIILPKGKTVSRRLRVIDCVPDLKKWIDTHPFRDDLDAPLWINISTKCPNEYIHHTISASCVKKLLKVLAKRAGIKKNVYPHLFRHSRLTELAKMGFNESSLRIIAGWSADSSMPKVYIHLSGADVEKKLLEIHGLVDKKDKENTEILRNVNCWRCKEKNGASAKFCTKCGADLDEEKRRKDRMMLTKESKDIDLTKVEEMLELLNRMKEEKKISAT